MPARSPKPSSARSPSWTRSPPRRSEAGGGRSEFAVFEVRRLRVHSVKDRLAHDVFRFHYGFGARHRLLRRVARHDDDAVAVAEHVVAAAYRRISNCDGLPEGGRDPAGDDVGRGEEADEDGEAHLEDEDDVAAAAANDEA